jgi:hypothetical protein
VPDKDIPGGGDFPFIPMMSGVHWCTYSTVHFTGWPTPSNYDAIRGRGLTYLDELKVETTIRPVT